MLPVSASDIIEFKPAEERVFRATDERDDAKEALAKCTPSSPAKKSAPKSDERAAAEMRLAAAEEVLAAAEGALAAAAGNPIFSLRVPTERSKAAVNRDITSEAVVLRSNVDVLDSALAAQDEISPADAEFLKSVRAATGTDGVISDDNWPRVFSIARSVHASAQIIADWLYHSSIRRIHLIRHHLIIDGQRSPLRESVFEAWVADNSEFAPAVGEKIDSLLTVRKATAKN
jgi:hypothetical protein